MSPSRYVFPDFPLLTELPWLKQVSLWSAPPATHQADTRDAFLLGGEGHISARLGMRDRVSTMDRILAPYLSSYNFGENNNFFLDSVSPSRDFYPPLAFAPTSQHIWRVRNTAIIITAERDATFELVTVNAVHPDLHCVLRSVSLKNVTSREVNDIGISFEASPDIPYPKAGHRSRLEPHSAHSILETLEELGTVIQDSAPRPVDEFERNRYLVRGVTDCRVRGYQDVFAHFETLGAKKCVSAVHYLAPGLEDTSASAIASGSKVEQAIRERGIASLFQEIFDFWKCEAEQRTKLETSQPKFTELFENNAILQKTVERSTGGYVVIDDYTGTWLRDHNGSHKLLLDLGKHEDVRRSMDRYYGLDRSNSALISCYPSDFEPATPLPPEPKWQDVEQWVPGDVPNFRTLWYAWYFACTGDLEYIRDRFDYMQGAFLRQNLHATGYLAKYCYDETYGIGPVATMRKGLSCDNSFIALSAAKHLARFAELLGHNHAAYFTEYANNIHAAIENTFWLEKKKYYAMRITPEGKRDETPLSVGLLRPLWTGALGAEHPHAILSALYTFQHLYQPNGFIKLIPSHDQTVTMAIGYLLIALKKIGHPAIERVMKDMVQWADPSGTFGEYLDNTPQGPRQCFEHLAHRSRMWESGLNSDALFYALTGSEPSAFERKLTLSPYLPKGWKYYRADRIRIGDTYLSMLSDRTKRGIRYTLEGVSGGSTQVTLKLSAKRASRIRLNNKPIQVVWTRNQFGMYHTSTEVLIDAGQRVVVDTLLDLK